VPVQDTATIGHLLNMDRHPVGTIGDVAMSGDGVPEWRVG
jgi:acetyl-CoA C-acetyltransferase